MSHSRAATGFAVRARTSGLFMVLGLAMILAVGGCGRQSDDAALDSDANGFLCLDCTEKFYTDREVFANRCPACQKGRVEMVLGFVCPSDGEVTYAPRGRGSLACGKCGKVTGSLTIPREAELKAWGASHSNGPEVGAP